MNCSQNGCGQAATMSYVWPGAAQRLYACADHWSQARGVSEAMGFPLGDVQVVLSDGVVPTGRCSGCMETKELVLEERRAPMRAVGGPEPMRVSGPWFLHSVKRFVGLNGAIAHLSRSLFDPDVECLSVALPPQIADTGRVAPPLTPIYLRIMDKGEQAHDA